ncbi:MAG: cytochrome b N-terminal domain-containing protein [Burkholderiales bacterium]|nr:cytochrome b N-terminal domain-containing protein [Burkholderiales bacterium]
MLKLVHRAGRWAFLRVESFFNLAFGDRLNPLYYLGPISYFLFWIVLGSGLYLYIFFDTGVEEAYASVEQLTHGQWYFGGILRSLHRYASDGMVLTMLLHLARHFVFDRYRAFRWFSWVSGVVLLWLIYSAGINGYMLPWDRLAQFVVIATAEWFDWIPVFGGTLVRNFIFPENVNDRLFSLLSFIHIGIPLAALALLMVHTQRVPQARTSPPWPIAATLSAALVVLSLLKPALSQAPADLASAVTVIDFDWFYLPVYALLYRWSPGEVWALVGGATALFLLAPWLPPKRRRVSKEGFHLLVRPDNHIISVREGESILDAGLREGIAFPFECRNGGCGKCKATLTYGEIDPGNYQKDALSEAERAAGKLLLCCATALSDIEVEYEPTEPLGGRPIRTYNARVTRMNRLAPDVMQVFLALGPGEQLDYYAGQYINVLLPNGEHRSFSFATAPHVQGEIELQIRLVPGGKFTPWVFDHMQVGDTIRFEAPLGSFFLREDSDKPIIFVAGSTGFAPVKSMVEHALHIGLKRNMLLYWGVRRPQDLYLGELPRQWEREHANFKFIPVMSDPAPEDHWTGRIGLVHEAILADFPDLAGHQIYACGSVDMVAAAHPAFLARGLAQEDCFSDTFLLPAHKPGGAAEIMKPGGGR